MQVCVWLEDTGLGEETEKEEIHQETREETATSYLMERLSVVIQKGKAAAVFGSYMHP